MFSSIFNSVVEKLSGLNPIKGFIKYALDKFLNELINDQITLEDFKNGCLNLTGISFNVDKVNEKHLVSSPYILHSGSIGSLKIQLPPLTQMSRKSIEIEVRDILIELKPNKDFYKNFKERIKQLQANTTFDFEQSLPDEQISENNPMDFFKETLKHILLNIKVKVQNIVVKIYMNNPSQTTKKNQFYLMMRIPTINVHKNNDLKKKMNKDVQEIKLDIEMPQFTVQLINDGVSFPEFENQNFKKQDYPFNYPTISHPSTILLFGLHDFKSLNIQTDKTIPRLTVSIMTDYKNKKRDLKVDALTSNIEFMADPLQIKVLSRFFHQTKQFKNIFDYVKHELNIGQQNANDQSASQDLNVMRRSKSIQIKNNDIFSSICMSIWQPQGTSKSKIGSKIRKSNLVDSIMRQSSDLSKSIHNFNVEFKKQLKGQDKLSQVEKQITFELRVVNFEKNMEINLQVNEVYLYVLKSTLQKSYYRKWMGSQKQKKINQSIPLSHFMFSLKKMTFSTKENGKNVQLSITQLKLQNVKLYHHQNPSKLVIKSSQSEFVDMRSSSQLFSSCNQQFQSFDDMRVSQDHPPTVIKQFCLNQKDHYCVEQIIRISQRPSDNFYSETIRKYSFLPKPQDAEEYDYVVYKPGFKFSSNKNKNTPLIKIDVLEIAVSVNPEIAKEIMEIYFPVEDFQKLSANIAMDNIGQVTHKDQPEQKSELTFKKRSLLESQYNFGKEYIVIQEYMEKKEKPIIKITVQQINLSFYESSIGKFSNLTQKYQKKGHILHNDCFCNMNSKGLYFECFGIQVDKKEDDIKLGLRKIISGYVEVKNSKLQKIKALFNIDSLKNDKSLKLVLEKNQITKIQNIFLVVPELCVRIQAAETLGCIELVKRQFQIAEQIFAYYRFLKSSMDSISRQIFNVQKKPAKKAIAKYEQNLQLYIESFKLTILKTEVFARHIYLKKFTDQIIFKLSTFVLSLRQNVQLFLNEMKNQQLCLRQYIERTSRYPFILDSNIILEMHDDTYKGEAFESKNRLAFFQKLSKTNGSISFDMSKNSLGQSGNGISKPKQAVGKGEKFQFSKRPNVKNSSQIYSNPSIIVEQSQLRKIILNASSPVYVSATNVFRLLQSKQYLTHFVQKVKSLQSQIALETKAFSSPQRKNSTDSDIEKFQIMEVKISAGKINVDVRPTFVQKLNENKEAAQHQNVNLKKGLGREIVFSSTRSYLEVEWDAVDVKNEKRVNLLYCTGMISVRYHFLEHQQRELITNPIFINQRDLKALGFLQIFELKNLNFILQKTRQSIRIKTQISSILYQSSISTLAYLRLHLQHFSSHNVNRKLGLTLKQQEEKFQVLQISDSSINENKDQKQYKIVNLGQDDRDSKNDEPEEDDADDDEVEDLTDAFEKYSGKIQKKKLNENAFKDKKFIEPLNDKTCEFFLELFKVKELKLKIYSGSDFQFLSCDSMNESKEMKRSRINDSEIFKYLEIRIDHFNLTMKTTSLKQLDAEAFVKIQNFEVNFSNKKQAKGMFSRFLGSNKYSQQVVFPILKSEGQMKLLLQHNSQKTYLKLNKTSFEVGFTSEILQLVQEIKKTDETIQYSGWKKVYEQKSSKKKLPQEKDNNAEKINRLIMVYVPQNRLTIRLIYKGIQMLSNQSLYANQFLLHEQSQNLSRINKIVIKWVKNLLFKNIGGLISGSTLSFLGNVIEEVLEMVKFVLGAVFRTGAVGNQQ